jgi:hypothetical protein
VSTPTVRLPLRTRTPAAAHPDRVRGGALAAAVPVAAVSVLATAGSVVAVLDVDGWAAAGGGSLPVDVVVGTTYPLVGALVLAGRRPSRRLGWLLLGVRRRRRADGRRDHRCPARRRTDPAPPCSRSTCRAGSGSPASCRS